jgi:hypothetical protein
MHKYFTGLSPLRGRLLKRQFPAITQYIAVSYGPFSPTLPPLSTAHLSLDPRRKASAPEAGCRSSRPLRFLRHLRHCCQLHLSIDEEWRRRTAASQCCGGGNRPTRIGVVAAYKGRPGIRFRSHITYSQLQQAIVFSCSCLVFAPSPAIIFHFLRATLLPAAEGCG